MRVRVDGEKIKEIRLERLMQRGELQTSSGISYSTLSQIENGKRTARLDTVNSIAAALGVEPQEIISGVVLSR